MTLIQNYPKARLALSEADTLASAYVRVEERKAPSCLPNNTVTVVHHHEHYCVGGWDSSSYWRTREYSYGNGESDRGEGFRAAGVVGAIAVLGVAYFIGANIGRISNGIANLKHVKEVETLVSKEVEDKNLLGAMSVVFDKERQLIGDGMAHDLRTLATKIGFLASSLLTFVGGVVCASNFVAVGAIGMLGCGAVMLYQSGSGSVDQTLEKDVIALQGAVRDANALAFA